MDNKKCKCGAEAEDYHICPYAQDIDGDEESQCNCCVACQNNCADDV